MYFVDLTLGSDTITLHVIILSVDCSALEQGNEPLTTSQGALATAAYRSGHALYLYLYRDI